MPHSRKVTNPETKPKTCELIHLLLACCIDRLYLLISSCVFKIHTISHRISLVIRTYTVIGSACALSIKVLDETADSTFHTDVFSCWQGLDLKFNGYPIIIKII